MKDKTVKDYEEEFERVGNVDYYEIPIRSWGEIGRLIEAKLAGKKKEIIWRSTNTYTWHKTWSS